MNPFFYSDTICNFITTSTNGIFGTISLNSDFPDEPTQKGAWNQQIKILKEVLKGQQGKIFFEYSIPRMGRRIDVVLIIQNVIFVLEFKMGEKDFNQSAVDQVWDYALDLKNFHEMEHKKFRPISIAGCEGIFYVEFHVAKNNKKSTHETSHTNLIAPVLISTESKRSFAIISEMPHNDNLLFPIRTNTENLNSVIHSVLDFAEGENINMEAWAGGRY